MLTLVCSNFHYLKGLNFFEYVGFSDSDLVLRRPRRKITRGY